MPTPNGDYEGGPFFQEKPASATDSDYTIPADRQFTGNIIITNDSASADSVTVWIAPSGATVGNEHKIVVDEPVAGNDSVHTTPLSLTAGTLIRMQSSGGNLSFTVNGIQQTTT